MALLLPRWRNPTKMRPAKGHLERAAQADPAAHQSRRLDLLPTDTLIDIVVRRGLRRQIQVRRNLRPSSTWASPPSSHNGRAREGDKPKPTSGVAEVNRKLLRPVKRFKEPATFP